MRKTITVRQVTAGTETDTQQCHRETACSQKSHYKRAVVWKNILFLCISATAPLPHHTATGPGPSVPSELCSERTVREHNTGPARATQLSSAALPVNPHTDAAMRLGRCSLPFAPSPWML